MGACDHGVHSGDRRERGQDKARVCASRRGSACACGVRMRKYTSRVALWVIMIMGYAVWGVAIMWGVGCGMRDVGCGHHVGCGVWGVVIMWGVGCGSAAEANASELR